jgi:hypothetical protein
MFWKVVSLENTCSRLFRIPSVARSRLLVVENGLSTTSMRHSGQTLAQSPLTSAYLVLVGHYDKYVKESSILVEERLEPLDGTKIGRMEPPYFREIRIPWYHEFIIFVVER